MRIEFPLPALLAPWLDRYLAIHRPLLLQRQRSEALWISSQGMKLRKETIYERVITTTQRIVGQKINPHRFRHITATAMSEADPQSERVVEAILGHTSRESLARYYDHGRMEIAFKHYTAALDAIRREATPPTPDRIRRLRSKL